MQPESMARALRILSCMTHPTVTTGRLQKISLGFGYLTVFFLSQAIPVLAVPHYQMTLGINPSLLGALMAIPLLLASCFGIWFGHTSDRLPTRFGRRRPWMLLAALITAVSYGFLWMPPDNSGHLQLLLYFGALGLVFQLASVVYSVSLNSLVYESSTNSAERTRLMGFTTYFVKLGSLCYQWLYPLSALSLAGGIVLGVQGVGWLVAVLIFFVMGLLPVISWKEPLQNLTRSVARPPAFVQSLRAALDNQAMVFVMTLAALQMGGAAYVATMDYYLLVYFVHGGDITQGAISKGFLSTAYALVSFLSVPLVVWLARRYGRLNALVIIYLINTLGGVLKWFLFVPGAGLWITADALLCGSVWSAMVILLPSMIADLAQHQGQRSQTRCAGMFASIHGWVLSASAVVVLLLSGLTLSATGFDATLGGQQPPSALLLMRIILAGGTVLFSLMALMLVRRWQANCHNYQFNG